MSVVRKSSSISRITIKPAGNDISVVSIRNPSRIEEMGDTGFGTLNESKDGMVVSYDNSTDRFKLYDILREVGFNRIGVAKTFIHVDIDKDKSPEVFWVY